VSELIRTVVVKSLPLPRTVFKVLAEFEGMYRNVVEQLVLYAVRNGITSFTRLKALKYRELSLCTHSYHRTTHTQRAKTRPRGRTWQLKPTSLGGCSTA